MQRKRLDRQLPGSIMVLQKTSNSNLVFIGSLIVLVHLVGFVQGNTTEKAYAPLISEHDEGPFDCGKMMMRAAKQIIKVLGKCSKDVKANTTSTKEFSEKMGCVMKCVMVQAKLANANYQVTDETVLALIHQFVANKFLLEELQHFVVGRCRNAAAKLNPKEEKCISYSDYVMCLQGGLEDFMNSSKHCIKKPKKKPVDEVELSI